MQSLNNHFEELLKAIYPEGRPPQEQLDTLEACFMAGVKTAAFEIGRNPLSYIAISHELDTWFEAFGRKHGL